MEKIKAYLIGNMVTSNTQEAHSLHAKSTFGEPAKQKGKIIYMATEALFLVEKNKMSILNAKDQEIPRDKLLSKLKRFDKKLQIKYPVFKDLREKGHVVKTALKFGAEFRVYEKSKKPGKAHAKWIVFTDHESNKTTWHEFSAKNRVAHSTKKNLLLAIVDEESDITYYEVRWLKP